MEVQNLLLLLLLPKNQTRDTDVAVIAQNLLFRTLLLKHHKWNTSAAALVGMKSF